MPFPLEGGSTVLLVCVDVDRYGANTTLKLRQILVEKGIQINIYIPTWQDIKVQIYAATKFGTKSADSPRPN